MKQLLLNSKISLITYKDNISFPTYREDKNLPLLTNTSTIDLSDNYNTFSGDLTVANSIISYDNCFYISFISNNFFGISIGNSPFFITKEFNYHNLSTPMNIRLLNGTYDLIVDPVTSAVTLAIVPGITKNITIQYFILRGI
jgi:hypothetical protein